MRKSSSGRWLKEHFSDTYVKKAKSEGFRARSIYKLMEINERYKLIKPGMVVVDLGAAPGGWSQYVAQLIGQAGKVFALDILPMQPIAGVEVIQGDFTDQAVVKNLYDKLGAGAGPTSTNIDKKANKANKANKVDLVLSDMAPNLSGIKVVDDMRSIDLAEKAFRFARLVLGPKGSFLVKTFQSGEFKSFLQELRKSFSEVKVIKPEASRARSSEVFILCQK